MNSGTVFSNLVRHARKVSTIFALVGTTVFTQQAFADFFTATTEQELRDALVLTSDNGESDTILLQGNTITLTYDEATEMGGQLLIQAEFEKTVSIRGGTIRRDTAGPQFRLIKVLDAPGFADSTTVSLIDLTLENGLYITGSGPASEAGGGAVFSNRTRLSVAGTTFRNNSVFGSGSGGAIFTKANSTISRSYFLGNSVVAANPQSVSSGGAIAVNSAQISIGISVLENNSADRGGAVFLNDALSFFTASSLLSNEADSLGGAVWTNGSLLSTDRSTFFNNEAGVGGGAFYTQLGPGQQVPDDQSIIIRHTTITGNSGGTNGGAFYGQGGLIKELRNSIVTDNGLNCQNLSAGGPITVTNAAGSIIDDDSCVANPTRVAANGGDFILLEDTSALFETGFAADNGIHGNQGYAFDFLPTVALTPTSPAVNASINSNCTVDQRLFPAVGICDSGAFEEQSPAAPLDSDGDGIADVDDNCVADPNPGQTNTDGDFFGDVCDPDDDNDGEPDATDAFPLDAAESADTDTDGIGDNGDNCPLIANANQIDTDNDLAGNGCDVNDDNDQFDDSLDNCPLIPNDDQSDNDGDGIGDVCDDSDDRTDTDGDGMFDDVDLDDDGDGQLDTDELACGSNPLDQQSTSPDSDGDNVPDCVDSMDNSDVDGDGVAAFEDNCPIVANADQTDTDGDGAGNACDINDDNDQLNDNLDNCPLVPNDDQSDVDGDGVGDVCDNSDDRTDTDGDGIFDDADLDDDGDGQLDTDEIACGSNPLDEQSTSADSDGDNVPDCVDNIDNSDSDSDGVAAFEDNCPVVANADQIDTDADGAGDACDANDDNDLLADGVDNCPLIPNDDQADIDGDGIGDVCDSSDDRPDSDGDGIVDVDDNCPAIPNVNQSDSDGNGVGDACEVAGGTDEIRPAVSTAAADLNSVISGLSGTKARILRGAAWNLNLALRNANWANDNTLTNRRGIQVFTKVSKAVNEIERIADARSIDAGLRTELDAISSSLLDSMRQLASDKIDGAVAANEKSRKINRAKNALASGDRQWSKDWLRGAVSSYGTAWRLARNAM